MNELVLEVCAACAGGAGGFALEVSRWMFRAGGFVLEVSCWRFRAGGFVLEVSCWRFRAGGFVLEVLCWRFVLLVIEAVIYVLEVLKAYVVCRSAYWKL